MAAGGGVGDEEEGEGVEGEEGAEVAQEMEDELGVGEGGGIGDGGAVVAIDDDPGQPKKAGCKQALRKGEDDAADKAAGDEGNDANRQTGAEIKMQPGGDEAADEGQAGHALEVAAEAVGGCCGGGHGGRGEQRPDEG